MTTPWPRPFRGRLDEHVVSSEVLLGNPLSDPHERPLWVWTPPGYDAEPERRYPSVYVIQGYTGQLDMWRNRSAFRRNFPELLDELAPDCVVAFVDTWTSVGGSQFVDSPATGRYHTYLCDELVPLVDARYRTLAAPEHRGIQGKSSGGYGALLTALLRPDVFGGVADHAGGGLFEVSIRPFFREVVRTLRDLYGGSVEAWLADFRSRPASSRPNDIHLLLQYGFRPHTRPTARSGSLTTLRRRKVIPGALGAVARLGLADAPAAPRRRGPQRPRARAPNSGTLAPAVPLTHATWPEPTTAWGWRGCTSSCSTPPTPRSSTATRSGCAYLVEWLS